MKYSKVENARFVSGGISADVTFDHLGTVPFLCTPTDPEAHGRNLYADLMSGIYGEIAPATMQPIDLMSARAIRNTDIANTQWIVDRHRDELDLEVATSISGLEFKDLLIYRKLLRDWPTTKDFPNQKPKPPAWIKSL